LGFTGRNPKEPEKLLMEQTATILYVEDNPENRMLVRRILQAEGYRVLEAQNATHAIEVVENEKPDLVLMDINMPDIDGYTLTTQFKSMTQFQQTPIIALTANVMKGDRERTLEAGCDGYIQKPIDVDELPNQIKRFLVAR
jgi:two-component system cell cycle response regulator DivK